MAVLMPAREDRSETWMSTTTLSAIGQFKGSAFRFSTSASLHEGHLPLGSLLGAGSRCWPIRSLGSSLDVTG